MAELLQIIGQCLLFVCGLIAFFAALFVLLFVIRLVVEVIRIHRTNHSKGDVIT